MRTAGGFSKRSQRLSPSNPRHCLLKRPLGVRRTRLTIRLNSGFLVTSMQASISSLVMSGWLCARALRISEPRVSPEGNHPPRRPKALQNGGQSGHGPRQSIGRQVGRLPIPLRHQEVLKFEAHASAFMAGTIHLAEMGGVGEI